MSPTSKSENDRGTSGAPEAAESETELGGSHGVIRSESENADVSVPETVEPVEHAHELAGLTNLGDETVPDHADDPASSPWDDASAAAPPEFPVDQLDIESPILIRSRTLVGTRSDWRYRPPAGVAGADVARAELGALRRDFRIQWGATHAQERCVLDWRCPGSVWAMEFSHAPHLIDGCYRAIMNVRDLASHQQLLWLAVSREDTATVKEALGALFAEHGPPLVMKCDNGPAFRAWATKRPLLEWDIFTLYSSPYCAWYNGACERANRTLKELTAHLADRAGRPGFSTSDDLLAARLRANRLSRPWGSLGRTPEESWTIRGILSLDEREFMWQHLKRGIADVVDQRAIDPTAVLPHYTQTEIERVAAQPVLEERGLLRVTRRRIAPVF